MIKSGDHVVDHVDDYLHELLSESDAQYVNAHIAHCAICRTALEEATRRLTLLRSSPAVEPSEVLIHRTMNRVIERSKRRTPRQIAWRTFGYAMAASILIIGALHLYFLNLSPSPYDLRVVAASQMLSDTDASLRAIVSRGDTSAPISGTGVRIELIDDRNSQHIQLAQFTTDQQGSGQPKFHLPNWTDGDYKLRITASPPSGTEIIERSIKLRRSWKVMLSCDKPVYQPGQTIHFRALSLRQPDLKPVAGQEAVFSVTDPKGNVIFKTKSVTSRFGITSSDCVLADEIIEGAYAVQCRVGDVESKQTVDVKKYVLPKFRIDVETDKPYYQPGQRIAVSIRAGYFFGKPVARGQVQIDVSDGATTQQRQVRLDQDGHADLDWPLPQKLIGRQQDGGDARIAVDVLVRDSAGQEQHRTVSRIVTASPLRIELIPESGELTSGIANTVYLLTTYADGTPAKARVSISGIDHELRTGELGAGSFEITPSAQQVMLTVRASDDRGLNMTRQVTLNCGQNPSDFVLRTDKAVYRGSETMKITTLGGGDEPVFIDLIKDGQTLVTHTIAMSKARGEHSFDLPAELFGTLQVNAYRFDEYGLATRKNRIIYVERAQQLKLQIAQDQTEYRPGGLAKISFNLTDTDGKPAAGAISLAAVDEAVFSVMDQSPGMERVFFTLEQEMLKPIYAIYGGSDFASAGALPQMAQLQQALFSRAGAAWVGHADGARAQLEKIVKEGDLTPAALDVLDDPRASEYLDNLPPDDPIRSLLQQAVDQGNPVQRTYPAKFDRIVVQKYQWLESIKGAWLTLFVIVVVAAIFRLSEVAGWSRVASVLLFLMLSSCLVSIMLPSLNRARETAERVKASANMRSLELSLMQQNADKAKGDEGGALVRLRQWFPETLLWRPELITDDMGRANLNLDLADSITTWRMTASAVSAKGQLGAAQSGIRVFQPFFVDLNLPVALTRNDEIAVPVAVYSYLDRAQTVELTLDKSGDWFELLDEPVKQVELAAGDVRSVSYRLRVRKVGMHDLQISARGAGVADAVKRTIEVIPDGRRIEQVINGSLQQPTRANLLLPSDAIEGSAKLIVKIYPSGFSQLVEGLDGIFQRPYGCFEQTSSTTYPNILALRYLKQTNKSVPEVEAKAREYINLGYQRLVGFEVNGGGFEWFGRSPANIVLTAYGLMEFQDMKEVYNIDPNLIERTRQWLLSQRNSDGTWPAGNMLHDGLAESVMRGADANLATTAYTAWAVFGNSSAGSVGLTLDYLRRQRIEQINDPYIMAVLANALLAIDPNGPVTSVAVRRLAAMAQASADGKLFSWAQATGSRTAFYGAGAGGSVETTAMATLAMLRAGADPQITRGALSWLITQKDSNGTWPSTQATVLALKALITGTGQPLGREVARSIRVSLGDGFTRQITIPVDQADVMQQIDLTDHLRAGANTVEIAESTGAASGYQIAYRYYTPGVEAKDEPLSISMDYDRTDLPVGQTMTASATITNRTPVAAPMIILDLPIPAGFHADAGTFEELKTAGRIEKFQFTARSVIVYLRSLQPGEPLVVRYRLNATMPVKITAPPAKVYEYYDTSRKAESAPAALRITPHT